MKGEPGAALWTSNFDQLIKEIKTDFLNNHSIEAFKAGLDMLLVYLNAESTILMETKAHEGKLTFDNMAQKVAVPRNLYARLGVMAMLASLEVEDG